MSELQDRQIVLPGQLLGERIRCEGPCLREREGTFSTVRGLARVDKNSVLVIPQAGPYLPKAGDIIIGVVDADMGGVYSVDVKGPYRCILKQLRERGGRGGRGGRDGPRDRGRRQDDEEFGTYVPGDVISAKVAYVDEVKEAKLMGPRKLEGGYVMQVKPMKVPRIIGKQKSMITLIREYSGSNISVGQNGLIWIAGGNMALAQESIRMVESQAHTAGLTDRMTMYMRERSKK